MTPASKTTPPSGAALGLDRLAGAQFARRIDRASRDALDLGPGLARFARAEIESGHAVLAVVCDQSGVVACGWHAPRGGTTEITGVSTLPSARHRGHAAVVVEALIEDAAAGGCTTALLSADGDAVASIYERVGFRRVGVSASAVMHS